MDIPRFGALDAAKLRKIGKKLDEIRDPTGFEHWNFLRKQADDPGLVWHLVRHGLAGNPVRSAGLVRMLSNRLAAASVDDVITVLKRLPEDMIALDGRQDADPKMLTPGVLLEVDKLLTWAYRNGRDALLAVRDALPENLRLAVDFVRRRAGETIDEGSARRILAHLVEVQCTRGLLYFEVPRVVNGDWIRGRLEGPDDVRQLALLFGSAEEWEAGLRDWVLRRVSRFRRMLDYMTPHVLDGLRGARLRDVVYSYCDGYWSPHTLLSVLDARDDAPSALFSAASTLAAEGSAPFRVEIEQIVEDEEKATAGEEDGDADDYDDYEDDDDDYEDDYEDDYDDDYDDDHEDDYDGDEHGNDAGPGDDARSRPQLVDHGPDHDAVRGVVEMLTVVAIERATRAGEPVPPGIEEHFDLARVSDNARPYAARLRAALESLGPERAHAVVRRVLERKPDKAAAIADVCFDPALAEEVFARIDDQGYGHDAGTMGMCGPSVVPILAAHAASAGKAATTAAYEEAILYVLAQASARGESWDPAWDAHVRLDRIRFSYGGAKVEPVLEMLRKLPLARYEAVMRASFERCASEPWRLVRCLRPDVSDELLAAVLAKLVEARAAVRSGDLGTEVRALGTRVVAPLRAAFGDARAENTFMRELERALAPEAYAAFVEALARPIETKEEELRRLAESLPGPKVRIYRLTRLERAPAPEEIARVGGAPRGVVEPPAFRGAPMTHVLTLDLSAMPELAVDGARSVSLYLPDPDRAQHHERGALVWLREDELDRAPGSIDGAHAIGVEAFDVPVAIFDYGDDDSETLRHLRSLVYGSPGYAGGGPLWLQDGPEGEDPTFLFQFDESLAPINLGDAGVMYVFHRRITWQCH